MATRAELDLVVRALNRLSLSARSDFLSVWSRLDPTDWAATRRVLEGFWPDLIGHYGDMAAALAADQVALDGIAPQMVRGVDPARANARMRWAIGVPDQRGSMIVILDELVKQPYRSTVQRSAAADGTGWARVPSGAETCEWCLMLSSRGFVYESANAAGEGRKYHGDCDCVPVLGSGADDYPDGYDPDELYDRYAEARREARSGSPQKILQAAREMYGTN